MPRPPASRATTVAVTRSPTVTLESGALTLTEATEGGDTVTTKVAGPTPSIVTPIVALPGATAVASPVAETVTTPVALLDQTTVRPTSESTVFCASRASAVAWMVVQSLGSNPGPRRSLSPRPRA